MEQKEKLTILLAEYSALRAQLLQRNSIINQVGSITVSVLIATCSIIARWSLLVAFVVPLGFAPILIFTFRLNEWDMLVTLDRLEEIIRQVNEIAGEELLKTKTKNGRTTMGTKPNFAYAVRPFDKVGIWFQWQWRKRTRLH